MKSTKTIHYKVSIDNTNSVSNGINAIRSAYALCRLIVTVR